MYNDHMYRYYVTKRNPLALWMMDDPAPYQEYTGMGGAAEVVSGTPTKSVPLVAGAGYSTVFKSTAVGRITTNVFRPGKESRPFALEAWILPIPKTTTGNQKILSHTGSQWDGLSINGKVIRFGTEYLTTGSAFCDFDLQEYKLAHVVGLHTADQNQLWVNGEKVASVDITDEQKADTYLAADNEYLQIGSTQTGDQELAVNAIAVYPSLSGEQIQQNYEAGIDFIGQDRVYPQFGGVGLDLDAAAGAVYLDDSWVDEDDFDLGTKNNVEYAADQIEPSYVAGVPVSGTWTTSVPLDAAGDTSIYGALLVWSGNGVTVHTSLDGSTWNAVTNGRLTPTITNGMNPTGKDLDIRVTLAAAADSYLESLRVVCFRNNTVNNIVARPITVSHPAVLREDHEPNLYRDDNGVSLGGGTLTIGTDTSADPDVARTLELWIKPLSGTPTISVGGTKYRNGVADTTLPIGEWSLIHYVAAADIAGSITVTGNCIVGQASIYPTALSASDVDFIYKSYTGATVLRFTDTGAVAVSESATPASIYAHDWSIDAAG